MSEVKRYDCDISTKRDELEEGCLCEAVMDETTVGDYVTYDDYLTLQRERDELKKIAGRYRKCEKCGYQFLIQPAQSIVPCPNCQKVELKKQRDGWKAEAEKYEEKYWEACNKSCELQALAGRVKMVDNHIPDAGKKVESHIVDPNKKEGGDE